MKKYAYPFGIAFIFVLAWELLLGRLGDATGPAGDVAVLYAGGAALAGALGAALGTLFHAWIDRRGHRPALARDLIGDVDDDQWRDFISTAADWFWETDADHRFTFISDRFLAHYDIDAGHVIGRTRGELAEADSLYRDAEAWERHLQDLEARRPFRDFEYAVVGANGRVHYARVSGVPLFAKDGTFRGYRGFARDVTHERMADDALRGAKEEAELANRAKTEFLANMSHELRTPLNSIIGFSDILVNETFGPINEPRYREYAGDINDAGKHLLELINDLLDLARIERGQLHLNEQRLDLGLVVNACLRLVRERAFDAGVALDMEVPAGLPPLLADELRVKQALVNLLSNAVKFTERGGSVRVAVTVEPDGAVSLAVIDTGIGIAAEDISVALSEFGQVDGSLARRHEGTGLGLTLARKLIELHGGTLLLESEIGRGTTARLVFPARRALKTSQAS